MAIQKPAGYDTAEAREGGFQEPKAGPYILGIVRADVEKKGGVQKLVMQLDIASGRFKHYFKKQGDRFQKNRFLRVFQDIDTEKGLPHFKGIILAIEQSNPGYIFEFDEKTLVGKFVGGNLRDEEYEKQDGSIGTCLRIGYLCSVGSVERGEHKVMSVKKLKAHTDEFDQSLPQGVSESAFDQSIPPGAENF